jgi:hypothetical protein
MGRAADRAASTKATESAGAAVPAATVVVPVGYGITERSNAIARGDLHAGAVAATGERRRDTLDVARCSTSRFGEPAVRMATHLAELACRMDTPCIAVQC